MPLKAVDQTYNTVMPQKELFRQSTDRSIALMGKRTKSEKQLVVLRFQGSSFGGLVTSADELADAIAQFR